MPAVNYDLMLQEMISKAGGKVNQVVYWGRPLDAHNQTPHFHEAVSSAAPLLSAPLEVGRYTAIG